MKRNATVKFEYEDRDECVCGASLREVGDVITKTNSWGDVKFVRCNDCGSWCQSPQITFESLTNWFNSSDYQGSLSQDGIAYVNYVKDEKSRVEEARRRYKRDFSSELKSKAKILEVGCATGSLLSILQRSGHEVIGLDLSQKFVDAAREFHGLDIMLGDIDDFDLPKKYFDGIILMGTIGNLQDTTGYFRRFHELLVDNGKFIFNFVDSDAFVVKYIYRSNFWMFTPSVNCFMSSNGCKKSLEQFGFRIKSMRRDMQQPSFQKLFKHAKLTAVISLLKYVGLENAALPFCIPIPSVKLVIAQSCKL